MTVTVGMSKFDYNDFKIDELYYCDVFLSQLLPCACHMSALWQVTVSFSKTLPNVLFFWH